MRRVTHSLEVAVETGVDELVEPVVLIDHAEGGIARIQRVAAASTTFWSTPWSFRPLATVTAASRSRSTRPLSFMSPRTDSACG
jgi:hypothetical protein